MKFFTKKKYEPKYLEDNNIVLRLTHRSFNTLLHTNPLKATNHQLTNLYSLYTLQTVFWCRLFIIKHQIVIP